MTKLLTEKQVEEVYGLKVKTLRKWRWSGEGPSHIKLGRSVRYRVADIEAYIESCVRTSTSDTAANH
jgi:predicted DNA-binding transcriptional regulator AlpA